MDERPPNDGEDDILNKSIVRKNKSRGGKKSIGSRPGKLVFNRTIVSRPKVEKVTKPTQEITPPENPPSPQVQIETPIVDPFDKLLNDPVIEIEKLRDLCWNGVPMKHRNHIWLILLGIMPRAFDRRQRTLSKRIDEYAHWISMYNKGDPEEVYTSEEYKSYKQIELDIPRTNPSDDLFHHKRVKIALSHVLLIYSIRHPATGYVQGMNDLVVPLLAVFATFQINLFDGYSLEDVTDAVDRLTEDEWIQIEAKCFWSFSRIMEGIQDNYTRDQPGIQIKMFQMSNLVDQMDATLNAHLTNESMEYNFFAYRWMNCFLLREIPLKGILRMWDTYLCEEAASQGSGFGKFHVYVCVALLVKLGPIVKISRMEEIMVLLQNPNLDVSDGGDLGQILAQAFVYQNKYSLEQ